MIVIKAPNRLDPDTLDHMPRPWVFLAGSIEMGTADNWQVRITEALSQRKGTIWNPRRDNWDSSWEQRKSNPQFKEQVEWELDFLADADRILMYFDPSTKSPITLLELGLYAHADHSLIVCCPDGFWRKGNVEIVCERSGIQLTHTWDEFVQEALK